MIAAVMSAEMIYRHGHLREFELQSEENARPRVIRREVRPGETVAARSRVIDTCRA